MAVHLLAAAELQYGHVHALNAWGAHCITPRKGMQRLQALL
jgi:hypothetical protein